jgi:hypothetical protein
MTSLGGFPRHSSVHDFTMGLDEGVIERRLEHARGAKKGQRMFCPPGLARHNRYWGWPVIKPFRTDRVPQVPFAPRLSFHGPQFHCHFDSIEQAKSSQYRAIMSVKKCFSWENDLNAHNND